MNISEAQKKAYSQFSNHNERLRKKWTPFIMATKVLEEAGEVASDIMGLEGFKPKGKYTKDMLGRELSDLLFNIFIISETYDIDLESVYKDTIDKYEDYLFSE